MSAERPRDRLGRPLPADADPSLIVASVPVRPSITDEEAWTQALAYLERDLPFHAHEVFEQRWREAPQIDRAAWQALAQWGAALTHAARGNVTGARAVATRARALLASSHVPACVDVERVDASLRSLEVLSSR